MNEENGNELISKFLRNDSLDANAYEGMEIQELIFLIHQAKLLLATQPLQRKWLDTRIKEFLYILNEKIKTAETLYVAYDRQTNYPYIDMEDRVWFFSKEEYAVEAADYFLQQFVMLTMKKISGEEIMRTIGLLHILGLPSIVIDNGQYYIELKRDELIPPIDWSCTPEIQIPVTNSDLQHAMILFFQTMNARQHIPANEKLLRKFEDRMLDAIRRARYLIPMQLLKQDPAVSDEQGKTTFRQGDRIQFAVLEGEEDSTWLPVFTDWFEFEKMYDKELWSSNVATYEDLLALSGDMAGIILNPGGLGLRLDLGNIASIEKYRKERTNASSSSVTNENVPEDRNVLLGEPREYPMQMIEAIQAYMKTQKNIKKAYVRQKLREDGQSYLIVVDAEGQKEAIFSGIADAAAPHLNEMSFEIIEIDDWTEAMEEIKPFYKKKRFGLF